MIYSNKKNARNIEKKYRKKMQSNFTKYNKNVTKHYKTLQNTYHKLIE